MSALVRLAVVLLFLCICGIGHAKSLRSLKRKALAPSFIASSSKATPDPKTVPPPPCPAGHGVKVAGGHGCDLCPDCDASAICRCQGDRCACSCADGQIMSDGPVCSAATTLDDAGLRVSNWARSCLLPPLMSAMKIGGQTSSFNVADTCGADGNAAGADITPGWQTFADTFTRIFTNPAPLPAAPASISPFEKPPQMIQQDTSDLVAMPELDSSSSSSSTIKTHLPWAGASTKWNLIKYCYNWPSDVFGVGGNWPDPRKDVYFAMEAAVKHLQAISGVVFEYVPTCGQISSFDYNLQINFMNAGERSFSQFIGRNGFSFFSHWRSAQDLNLAPEVNSATPPVSTTFNVALHELYHVLGFGHEQTRKDRDKYITIDCSKNQAECDGQYSLCSSCTELPNIPYDYESIMHYPISECPKEGCVVMSQPSPLGTPPPVGTFDADHVAKYMWDPATNLSPTDVLALQAVYGTP